MNNTIFKPPYHHNGVSVFNKEGLMLDARDIASVLNDLATINKDELEQPTKRVSLPFTACIVESGTRTTSKRLPGICSKCTYRSHGVGGSQRGTTIQERS